MKGKIEFDVNLISKILFRPSYHNTYYEWKKDLVAPKYKRVLGIFKVKVGEETLPAAFYERRSNYYGDDSWVFNPEDYLISCGYLIKDVGTIGGISESKEVWKKAYVEVSLGYKSSVCEFFDTDEDAKTWIEHLKMLSGKTFETVELN